MVTLITILHITVSVFLILVVLLQTGKGAEMGATFGSGQAVFGAGQAASGFRKVTAVAAIIFMCTSMGLTILGRRGNQGSLLDKYKPPVTEQQSAPVQEGTTTETPQTPVQPEGAPTK